MCTSTGFHANQASRQIYEELGHLVAPDLLLNGGLAKLIDSVQLKHIFCQIDAYCSNLHVGRSCLFKWVGKHLHFGTLRCRLGGGVHPIGRRQQLGIEFKNRGSAEQLHET